LGGCHEYIILNDDCTEAVAGEDDDYCDEGERGPKILVIGLIEKDWLDTLSSVDPSNIIFESPTDYFMRRVTEIKALHGPFDAVVAVSHMRVPQDKSVAIDIGGGLEGVDISKFFLLYMFLYYLCLFACVFIVRSLIISYDSTL
jgi:2',3'-cyclic-nucleotide 2'-phosphodiesterase (5'-nucleotidase family)